MPIPLFLILFIIFVMVFTYKMRKVDRDTASQKKAYWDREEKALFVRKKSLDNLDYIHLTKEELPILDDHLHPDIIAVQHKVVALLPQNMVNFAGQSNTDLKLAYGTGNFETLSLYEERYNHLIRLLFKWGTLLHEAGKIPEAIQVLEVGVRIQTDISNHYILLGELYVAQNDHHKFQKLYALVSESNFMLKNKVIHALDHMRS